MIKSIALAGNPNVGKSTIFNSLTGMKQHTGNWPGKTITKASGTFFYREKEYMVVDLPGTYSLLGNCAEEEIAKDYILSGKTDLIIAICDATCLERNLNLVLQILQLTSHVIVCINLLDEAAKKNITVDIPLLQKLLGVPVVGMCAVKPSIFQKKYIWIYNGIEELKEEIANFFVQQEDTKDIKLEEGVVKQQQVCMTENTFLSEQKEKSLTIQNAMEEAEYIAKKTVKYNRKDYDARDRKIDGVLTNPITGIPVMLCLLGVVLWITLIGANYPSSWLSTCFFSIEDKLWNLTETTILPYWFRDMTIHGIYRVLAWVVSVMLPPMAIFFPLFTLLEDFGYLPRVAFNLDHSFKKCCSCGKQALTMCMGFGCNATGIIGCRIIDSPRERLIAILTNNFIPCNGRFPTP